MKAFFLGIFAAVLFAGTVNAQHVNFGVKGGLNAYTFRDGNKTNYGARIGFHAGALAHIHLADQFGLQPEVVFSTQGASFSGLNSTTQFRLNYVNVPVLFQYMFDMGFRIQAGPQLGVLLTAKSETNGIDSDIKNNFKPIDFGVAIGASYVHVPTGFGVDARVNLGLSQISAISTNPNTWNQGLQLGVFYLFGHKS
ncbi:MAG TPA: PorT family protein [Bacteroidetes bacterium]|nr:PorT family protein [Bacteroidota bacterium]